MRWELLINTDVSIVVVSHKGKCHIKGFKNKLNHLNPGDLKSLKLLLVFYDCEVFEAHFQGSRYVN